MEKGLIPFEQRFSLEIIWLDGEPLFNAYQVGEGLLIGESGVKTAISSMDQEDYVVLTNEMVAGYSKVVSNDFRRLANRGEWFLRESGLYEMILRSRKPEAIAFKRWLKKEVLPSIRKTGYYSTSQQSLPQTYEQALEHLLDAVRGKRQAEERLAIQAPMIEEYEQFLACHAEISMGEAAKAINFKGIGSVKLYAILRECEVLMSRNDRWNLPYQKYINLGWFAVKYGTFKKNGHDERDDYRKTVVTPTGLVGIYRLLKAREHPGQLSMKLEVKDEHQLAPRHPGADD